MSVPKWPEFKAEWMEFTEPPAAGRCGFLFVYDDGKEQPLRCVIPVNPTDIDKPEALTEARHLRGPLWDEAVQLFRHSARNYQETEA